MLLESLLFITAVVTGNKIADSVYNHFDDDKEISLMTDKEILSKLNDFYNIEGDYVILSKKDPNGKIHISDISSVLFKSGSDPIIYPTGFDRLVDFSISQNRPDWDTVKKFVRTHGFPRIDN